MRNERGINKATIAESGAFAAEMIADMANGELVEGSERVSAIDLTPVQVTTSLTYVNKRLGMDLSFEDIQQVFKQLQFEVAGNGEEFTVSVPSRRWDITIQADLVEEIARIYGYDKIPSRLPSVNAQNMGLTDWQAFKRRTNNQMLAEGFNQVIAYSLIGDNQTTLEMTNAKPVALDFPMSDDRRVMRTNLLSALLEIVQYNVARKTSDVAIFESGHVFEWGDADLPLDKTHLAAAWTGNAQANTWSHPARPVDFYDMKGVVESILASFNLDVAVSFEATSELADIHPGRTAKIYAVGQSDERVDLGYIGQLHPSIADEYDLKDTLVFEISLDEIYALPKAEVKQKPIAKFPGSDRDIAILVSDQVTNAEVVKTIKKASKGGILVDIDIFDVYQGDNIEDGKKSLAYSLKYLNPQATLTDEEVTNDVARITEALASELDAEIR
jgi:phenylalanyl-tRNA synthetase beta chain